MILDTLAKGGKVSSRMGGIVSSRIGGIVSSRIGGIVSSRIYTRRRANTCSVNRSLRDLGVYPERSEGYGGVRGLRWVKWAHRSLLDSQLLCT